MPGVFATPRPVPSRLVPALAGTVVIVLGLPVFLATGLPFAGWAIAAGLWLAFQVIAIVLERVPLGADNLVAAGIAAGVRIARAVVLVGLLVYVARSDSTMGLSAAILYASAFTVELAFSMITYLGGEKKA